MALFKKKDLGIKGSLMFLSVAQESAIAAFTQKGLFSKRPKKSSNIWDTLDGNPLSITFKNSAQSGHTVCELQYEKIRNCVSFLCKQE